MMHPHGMHGHHQPPHQPPHQLHPHHQQHQPHPHHGHPQLSHQQHHPHHHPHHQQHQPPHPLPHHQQHHALHQQQPLRQLHQHQPPAQPPPQPQQQPQPQQHHMQPTLHRDQPRILAAPIGQTGGGNMNMGLGVRMRLQRCPAPPPQITVLQSRSRPPPSSQLHRPPPPSHHLQTSLSTPTTSTPQPSSVTTTSVTATTTGSLPTASQQQTQSTVSTNGLPQFSMKPSVTTGSDIIKTDIIIPSDPGNSVNGSKEKTPMCLVNELARFNKIQHQYRLTSEQGPAHRRRFTVALRLGDGDKENVEEYTAEAPRIRAAQHAVAAEALRSTNFPRPPPRPPRALRNRRTNGSVTIMPTVELNALAMKLGEPTVYKLEHHPPQIGQTIRNGPAFPVPFRPRGPHPSLGPPPSMHLQSLNRNGRFYNQNGRFFNQNNRFAYPYNKLSNTGYREQSPYEDLYRVKLTVGSRVFRGEGPTPQAARHDAAARALQELKNCEKDECDEKDQSCQDVDSDDKSCSDVKSPVSMVHEIALKFNLPATFSVKSEKGPPHMKVFTTTCTVGEHVTEGDGNSKKISKKRAAEKMLEELKKLPTFKKTVAQPKIQKPKRKPQQPKKKTRNLIKEKGEAAVVIELNPVSRLLQWSNNRSGGCNSEPSYTLVEEARGQWRRGFLMQCDVAGHQTTGAGPNKKLAKRNAAENMLIELGLGKTPSPGVSPKSSPESSIEKLSETNKSPRKVTFSLENSKLSNSEGISPNATGRQLVPGVLLMQDYLSSPLSHFKTPTKNGVNVQTTATIAKELLRAGTSPTADALAKQDQHIGINANSKPISSSVISSTTGGNGNSQTSQVIRPKDQLLYLAKLLNFQVQFSDFPKGNHGEFLSLVTLSTEPPMVCHGGGLTTEQSHDQSARAALENLSQMGLDSVTPHSGSGRPGDGINSISGNSANMPSLLTNGITK